jgi:ParB/RepB/Spo0J family partition protein
MSNLVEIPISLLKVSSFNVRKTNIVHKAFDENIKSLGVIQPLTVRRVNAEYEIVIGQSRFKAAKKAGAETLACEVREMTDIEAMIASLSENIARNDITAIDKAVVIAQLLGRDDLLSARGVLREGSYDPLTVRALAAIIGVGKSTIDAWLEPLRLQPETMVLVEEKAVPLHVATKIRRTAKTPEDEVELAQEVAKVDEDARASGRITGPQSRKLVPETKLIELLNKPVPKEKIVDTLKTMRDTPIVRKPAEPEEEEVVPDDWVAYSYVTIGGHRITDEKLVDRLNRNYIRVAEHAEDMLKLWLDLRGYY